MNCGLEPSLLSLEFEFTGALHFCLFPKKKQSLDDQSEECILIGYRSGNIYRLLTKKTRQLIIARDIKFEKSLLGFDNLRNTLEPLYIYDDEKKDA